MLCVCVCESRWMWKTVIRLAVLSFSKKYPLTWPFKVIDMWNTHQFPCTWAHDFSYLHTKQHQDIKQFQMCQVNVIDFPFTWWLEFTSRPNYLKLKRNRAQNLTLNNLLQIDENVKKRAKKKIPGELAVYHLSLHHCCLHPAHCSFMSLPWEIMQAFKSPSSLLLSLL